MPRKKLTEEDEIKKRLRQYGAAQEILKTCGYSDKTEVEDDRQAIRLRRKK